MTCDPIWVLFSHLHPGHSQRDRLPKLDTAGELTAGVRLHIEEVISLYATFFISYW